ncbi:hypothetical protein ACFL6S_34845 [Candidatus Poribacteria bacterium]
MGHNKKQINFMEYIRTPKDFEKFCNVFLKTEVSRLVKVYTAAGSDRGIDAEYEGDYSGRCGRWVFQYKFADPDMDNQRKRRNLINAMRGSKKKIGELEKAHILNCDNYVLLTNIELTPGNRNQIREIKDKRGFPYSLICWDKADLESMIVKFPYIMIPFLPASNQILLPWEEMFRFALDGKHELLRYDYEIFGREQEIKQFESFLRKDCF